MIGAPKQCVIVATCLYTYHSSQKFSLFYHPLRYANERDRLTSRTNNLYLSMFMSIYWYLIHLSTSSIHQPCIHKSNIIKKRIFRIFLCLWTNNGKQWQTDHHIWSHDIQGRFTNFPRILQICLSFFSERKSIPVVKSMNEWINEWMNEWINENRPANWEWKNESLIN